MSDPREVIADELAEFNDGRVAGQDERDDADAILSALSEAGYVVVPQAEIERLERALGRFHALRNNVIATQWASWSNTTYPMVAILKEAGLDYEPPTEIQKLDHKQCYGGAGGMPDAAAGTTTPRKGDEE